jgi:hypothetical protein
MDRPDTSAYRSRRSHRCLIVSVLALAVGTLVVAASPALASSEAAKQRVTPKITIAISPAAPKPNRVVKVTGDVYPVELVGEFVILVVQKKSPNHKWTMVRTPGSGPQVQFTPPRSWLGIFNTTRTWAGRITGIDSAWEGSVIYGSPKTNLFDHYVDYSLTSAHGHLWAEYEFDGGRTLQYSGTPVADSGTLRWYFADSKSDYDQNGHMSIVVPRDSYTGDSFHDTAGVVTEVEDGKVFKSFDEHWSVWDTLWGGELPRPLLDDGRMGGTRIVHDDDDPSLTSIIVTTWDLAPPDSDAVLPWPVREGAYSWKYTPKARGSYRMRAVIFKTADHAELDSPWRTFTVR